MREINDARLSLLIFKRKDGVKVGFADHQPSLIHQAAAWTSLLRSENLQMLLLMEPECVLLDPWARVKTGPSGSQTQNLL